jgi:serine/threonine protein kinase
MSYYLTTESGPRPGLQLPIPPGRALVIGRGMQADLVLPPDDRTVSRRHAELEVCDGGVRLRDLQELGATLLNGKLLEGPVVLVAGDVVELGDTRLRLHTTAPFAMVGTDDDLDVLSMRDVVESARGARSKARQSPSGLTREVPRDAHQGSLDDADVLSCSCCGTPGIAPPRPDLWDASWLCAACIEVRRDPSVAAISRIGEFDVLRLVASGGMGAVYEAVSRTTGLRAAVKVLLVGRNSSPRIVQRFVREQEITKALRHPNIVCCYDVGTWQDNPYIASEFVDGGDGLTVASPTGPVHEALWLGADLFRALGYGHDLSIVHRDVKPANLLLARAAAGASPRAKLADFGLAKSFQDLGRPQITMNNEAGGSLLTASPEQVNDFSGTGPSADIYSGAATVYWMLTCSSPLVLPCPDRQASIEQKAIAILDERRKPLRDARPDVSRPVAELIDGLVARDPSMREGMHAREVAVALNALASRIARKTVATFRRDVPHEPQEEDDLEDTAKVPAGPATTSNGQGPEARLSQALEALEICIRMLERNVERVAGEVREAVETGDGPRIDRAVLAHEIAQADLESALARWEKLLWQP